MKLMGNQNLSRLGTRRASESGQRKGSKVLFLIMTHAAVFILGRLGAFSSEQALSTLEVSKTKQEAPEDQWALLKGISRGFRSVHVYSKAVPPSNFQCSHCLHGRSKYAQVNQDNIILALTAANKAAVGINKGGGGAPPFFVDLAANDAMDLSNSFGLEQNGWKGICIEPNPIYWYRLASLRTCTIIGAFVGGTEDGKEVDVKLAGVAGGIVAPGMDNEKQNSLEKRNLVSIATVFRETKVPNSIDYFSLDVEGAESIVMADFPWDQYKFKFMTIERPKPDLLALLDEHGYKKAADLSNWGETLFYHEASVALSEQEIKNIIPKA